jgi:hypothetical protein
MLVPWLCGSMMDGVELDTDEIPLERAEAIEVVGCDGKG